MRKALLLMIIAINFASSAQQEAKVRDFIKASDELFLSNPDSCYALRLKAAELIENSDSLELKANVHTSLAAYYLQQADLESTATHLDISIALVKGNNSNEEAWAYKLKANLIRRLGEHTEALSYQNKALDIYLERKDTIAYLNTLINSYLHYKSAGDSAGCLQVLESIENHRDKIDPYLKYFYLQNKGDYFGMIGDFEKAEESLLQAHGITEQQDMIDSRATVLMMLGDNSIKMGAYKDAENYLTASIELSDEHHLNHEKLESIEVLIKLLVQQNRMDEAYDWQSKLYSLKNEIYELEKINFIHSLEKKLEVSNYQKELNKKDAEIKEKELAEAKQSHKYQLALIALVVATIIGITVTFGLVRMRKLKKVIEKQHAIVAEKNLQIQEALDDINDSLNYSQRLQHSLLPKEEVFKSSFKDYFIFYRPKQKVSGDFYWLNKVPMENGADKLTIFAVADCTGHGVPGAMVSVVCTNALNRAVREFKLTDPGEILDKAREIVVKTLATKNEHVMDGMDISLCTLNHDTRELKWAGANNALWYAKNAGEIEFIRPTKQAIGLARVYDSFTTHSMLLEPGTRLYLFSDGYADQFGGEDTNTGKKGGKKFKSSSLKILLNSLNKEPLGTYPAVLQSTLEKWMGDLEQIDDICIVGVEV